MFGVDLGSGNVWEIFLVLVLSLTQLLTSRFSAASVSTKTSRYLKYEVRNECLWGTGGQVIHSSFLLNCWTVYFIKLMTIFIKCLFRISHKHRRLFHSKLVQDLIHRSYSIDNRLAPAFTYTPVYKDPKHSFKLQFFLGVFTGAIPKLKRTKKSHVFKTLRNTSCRIQNPVLVTFKRMMVGSLGSPTVHSCPAQLIQGIQSTCQ